MQSGMYRVVFFCQRCHQEILLFPFLNKMLSSPWPTFGNAFVFFEKTSMQHRLFRKKFDNWLEGKGVRQPTWAIFTFCQCSQPFFKYRRIKKTKKSLLFHLMPYDKGMPGWTKISCQEVKAVLKSGWPMLYLLFVNFPKYSKFSKILYIFQNIVYFPKYSIFSKIFYIFQNILYFPKYSLYS